MNDMRLCVDGGANVKIANIFDGLEKNICLRRKNVVYGWNLILINFKFFILPMD